MRFMILLLNKIRNIDEIVIFVEKSGSKDQTVQKK